MTLKFKISYLKKPTVKRQATNGKRIVTTHITDKGLVSKRKKSLCNKKTNHPTEK